MSPEQAVERSAKSLEQAIEQNHVAYREFAVGNAEPVKNLYSHGDDVTLANPFGGMVHGWRQVSEALDYAASKFRDGVVTDFERVAQYATPDLATVVEVEHWQAKFGGSRDVTPFVLRVTSTYRREDDGWKLAYRHADPLIKPDPAGPLRAS